MAVDEPEASHDGSDALSTVKTATGRSESGNKEGRSEVGSVVPENVLAERTRLIKVRRGGGGQGGVTWSTTPKEQGCGPGTGAICED